tara:strand:- start:22 stop:666 length:645 start_codon:yes stop_codon:yes gene_type:complete
VSKELVIIDYGLGNLFSLQIALKSIGYESRISDKKSIIESADRIILPGVGAFGSGMRNLDKKSLTPVLTNFAKSGRPVLGICLGMQLLLEASEEQTGTDGLGLIEGEVKKLKLTNESNHLLKIPQVGWNKIEFSEDNLSWKKTILENLNENSFFYFVHSYAAHTRNSADSLASTKYGSTVFSSVVAKNNISGTQFHPELSGALGLQILNNFMNS